LLLAIALVFLGCGFELTEYASATARPLQFRLLVQSLGPRLLHNLRTATRLALVQCVDGAKVNLLVNVVLQRRSEIVCVVMGGALGVVVAVVIVFIVAV
jgi:hypothetical protein